MRRTWRKLLWSMDGTTDLNTLGYDGSSNQFFFTPGSNVSAGFTTPGGTFTLVSSGGQASWHSIDCRDADEIELLFMFHCIDIGALTAVSQGFRYVALGFPDVVPTRFLPKAVRINPNTTFATAAPYAGLLTNIFSDTNLIGTSGDEAGVELEPNFSSGAVDYESGCVFANDDVVTDGTHVFRAGLTERPIYNESGTNNIFRVQMQPPGIRKTDHIFLAMLLGAGTATGGTATTLVEGSCHAVFHSNSEGKEHRQSNTRLIA